jgi:hypothetical protein
MPMFLILSSGTVLAIEKLKPDPLRIQSGIRGR